MKESFENAVEELKRVDHLFYVSLKYTRTVDMLRHVIERMISTYEFAIETLLKQAKEKKMVDVIPTNPAMRTELLKKTFPTTPEIQDAISLLTLLMRLRRSKYAAREEFRRHVTMIATLDNSEIIEVKIDTLAEYYQKLRDFMDYVKVGIGGEQ